MRHLGHNVLVTLVALSPLPSIAGDWTVSNNISMSSYLTDNLYQEQDGSSGMVVRVTPRIGLVGEGARVSGQLFYAPTVYAAYGEGTADTSLSHTLDARFRSILVKDNLFLDSAATARMLDTSATAQGDPTDYGNQNNTSQTYSFSVSPYTQTRFGSYASLITRVGFNTVQGESGASQVNSNEVSASVLLVNGARFTRLPWSMGASHRETSYEERTDTQDSVNATLGYRFDRTWRVDGQIGYQNYDVSTTRASTSGATYSGTVYWTPNPRLALEAQAGYRYYGNFWHVTLKHSLRRVRWQLESGREITNIRSAVLRPYTLGDLARDSGEVVPDGLDPDLVILTLRDSIDEDYLNTTFGGRVTIIGNRTTVSGTARISDRKYEVSGREQQITTFTLSGSRRMGGGISANVGFSWQDDQSETFGDSRYLRFTLGASRSLGRYTTLGVDVSRVQRTGDPGTDPFTEHRIGLVLTTRMF